MRISTKTHLDSVRMLELARSYFRLANPHPPLPTYTRTIYFTDEKTESLPVDIVAITVVLALRRRLYVKIRGAGLPVERIVDDWGRFFLHHTFLYLKCFL